MEQEFGFDHRELIIYDTASIKDGPLLDGAGSDPEGLGAAYPDFSDAGDVTSRAVLFEAESLLSLPRRL